MKRRRLVMAAALLALLVLGARRVQAQELPFLERDRPNPFAGLLSQARPLDLEAPFEDPLFAQYLSFYGLDFPAVSHFAGYVPSGGDQVFVHHFRPASASRGTVVVMHGYFVHTGLVVHLISALLEKGYTVVAIDLPGHGLSSGARASIGEFGNYSRALADITPRLSGLPGPLYLIGHSTGAAGAWEYLLQHPEHPYRRAVLAAPLVRSAYWELSLAGFHLGQGWLQEIPRVLRPTSSDPSFLAMVRKDPLQYPGTPVQWVRALIDWNQNVVEAYPVSQTPLLILQGDADQVVEWKYNLPFLQRKFLQSQVFMLPGANHDLLWEAPAIRQQAFAQLLSFLQADQTGSAPQPSIP